jgi:riboflavin kinase / FMN adenylyltransferase
MSHIYDLSNVNLLQPSIITIGMFDGVHRGHRHLVRRLVSEAHADNRLAVALTFFPHPDVVLRGMSGRYYLSTPDERADMLLNLGVDYVVTHPFNDETRQVRAADFVDEMIRYLKMDRLWVGADFALGYKREGDVPYLRRQGEEKGFGVQVVDMVRTPDFERPISSTIIRGLVEAGKVVEARELLGRGYTVSGEVVHGKKRGRAIGFPTANLDVWEQQLIPANGIYAGWAWLNDERFMALINVGISPTFNNKAVTVEAYLLDFDRDIYGQKLTISFEKYLRPEARYDNLQGLIEQISRDVEQGRAYLASLERG